MIKKHLNITFIDRKIVNSCSFAVLDERLEELPGRAWEVYKKDAVNLLQRKYKTLKKNIIVIFWEAGHIVNLRNATDKTLESVTKSYREKQVLLN